MPSAKSASKAAPRLDASVSGEVITGIFSASASIWHHAREWISWPPVAMTARGCGTTRRMAVATATN